MLHFVFSNHEEFLREEIFARRNFRVLDLNFFREILIKLDSRKFLPRNSYITLDLRKKIPETRNFRKLNSQKFIVAKISSLPKFLS